jgi:hypothetical protein
VATRRAKPNGLEQALATLINSQAQFVADMAVTNRRIAESDKSIHELEKSIHELEKSIDRRFRRIEELLLRHEQMLQALPETIRQKIGFEQSR